MTKTKLLYLIIITSSISLILLIKIEYAIYIDYSNSNGKTQALFGLKELFQYSYKRYYGIIPLLGFISSTILIRKKETKTISTVASIISLIALSFSLLSVWRIFI